MSRTTVTEKFCVTCGNVSNATCFRTSTKLSYPQDPSPSLYLKSCIYRDLEHEDFATGSVQIKALPGDVIHDYQKRETVLRLVKAIHELLPFFRIESCVNYPCIYPKKPQDQFVKPCGKWYIAYPKSFA